MLNLLFSLRDSFRTRAALQAEILALRHQLLVLQRSSRPHKLRLGWADRVLWVWLSRLWTDWRSALLIVKPETVIAWHRRGFRLYWTWKSRRCEGRPTVAFQLLFVFVILDLKRRRPVHFAITANPTADWTAHQLLEAFAWASAPRYFLRDRDGAYGQKFSETAKWMGIHEVLTAPQSPWQNPYVERLIGSIRRECLDHVIVFHEAGLRRILKDYFDYYERCRTHLSLEKRRTTRPTRRASLARSGDPNATSRRLASPLHSESCVIEAGFQTLA